MLPGAARQPSLPAALCIMLLCATALFKKRVPMFEGKFFNKDSAFVFTRGNGLGCCCCRQFCLFSKTRPPLLWKSWSPCLSTLSPCKRVWPSECACCSWSCILPAAAMHRLQVRPHHCTAYLLNSKALQFCICSMCSTRILACNEETRVLQLLSVC